MGGEATKKNLYDAATKGEVGRFKQLVEEDPYLVNEVSFARSRNLLHIATMWRQASIVEEVLKTNPQLALDLDSKKSSSLHIAAAQGSFEIAQKLLSIAPEMCWWRDCHDMNPVHIAAMNGHVEILEMLLKLDIFPAMEKVDRGQSVLHLCVKHGQLRALQVLVDKLQGDLVCAKDDDGDTILHLAVRYNQLETIRFLVGSNKTKKETPNSMGKTALDILNERSPDTTDDDYSEMERILKIVAKHPILQILPKLTDITMVVVILIATMAFQAAASPPGGVWQDDTSSHRAGEAVMTSTHPKLYKHFIRSNSTAFVSSLITIFLITTGLPSSYLIFLAIALYAMWVSLGSIAVSYAASVMAINPNAQAQSLRPIIFTVVALSLIIITLISVSAAIENSFLSWKSKKRRQEDFTEKPIMVRALYRIFQLWQQRKNVIPNLRLQTIFPCLLGSRNDFI